MERFITNKVIYKAYPYIQSSIQQDSEVRRIWNTLNIKSWTHNFFSCKTIANHFFCLTYILSVMVWVIFVMDNILMLLTFSRTPLYGWILGGASLLLTDCVSSCCASVSSPEHTLGEHTSSHGDSSEKSVSVPLSMVAMVYHIFKTCNKEKPL